MVQDPARWKECAGFLNIQEERGQFSVDRADRHPAVNNVRSYLQERHDLISDLVTLGMVALGDEGGLFSGLECLDPLAEWLTLGDGAA